MRSFEDTHAERGHMPTLAALFGPSGSGKTMSALRLATGIQRVDPGEIFVIDTESRRSLHYADNFDFRHVHFGAPFGPLDYLAAIQHCVDRGAKTIIVDSMSHEHEGPGGVLEMHDKEMGGNFKKSMIAWAKPKSERRRLINTVLQLPVNLILCFRAKAKIKPAEPGSGKQPVELGWMPIGGEEFVYEMTVAALLTPGCNGVPDWSPEKEASRQMVKLPEQFRSSLPGKQMSEDLGESMARWAAGNTAPPAEFKFPRGPHQGKAVAHVPVAYLTELANNPKVIGTVRDVVEGELGRRVADDAAGSDVFDGDGGEGDAARGES